MLSIYSHSKPQKNKFFVKERNIFFCFGCFGCFLGCCCAGHAEQCCVYTDLLLLHLIVVGYVHNVNGPAPYIYVKPLGYEIDGWFQGTDRMVYQSKAIYVRELPAAAQPAGQHITVEKKKGGRNGPGRLYSSTAADAAVGNETCKL